MCLVFIINNKYIHMWNIPLMFRSKNIFSHKPVENSISISVLCAVKYAKVSCEKYIIYSG